MKWILLAGGGLAALLIVIVVANATAVPDPFSADTCEEVADIALHYAQDALDAYGEAFDDFDPRVQAADAEFRAKTDLLHVRSETLRCDPFLVEDLVCLRADRLAARGPYGQQLILDMRSSC